MRITEVNEDEFTATVKGGATANASFELTKLEYGQTPLMSTGLISQPVENIKFKRQVTPTVTESNLDAFES